MPLMRERQSGNELPAALAGCPEQYSKSRSGVSECDRVVSGPMLDQAIKRGFIAENKLN